MIWTRRQWLAACAASPLLRPRAAVAFGDAGQLDLPVLEYDSPTWNPRPTATRRLLLEVEMTTSVAVTDAPTTTRASLDALAEVPMVILAGDRGFDPWGDAERDALRTWLGAGGLLLVDSSEGREDGAFRDAVARELAEILPGMPLAPIASEHVLFRSFYLTDPAPGRTLVSSYTEGLTLDDRLAVIMSHNDLMGAWARDAFGVYPYEMHPGGDAQRQMAYRFGVNIVNYALCLDYKEDQVHVNYLLRRRRWRVE